MRWDLNGALFPLKARLIRPWLIFFPIVLEHVDESSFRQSQLGQDFEAEYLKQTAQSALAAVDDPVLWLGVGLIAAVVLYVLIK